jgi:hypothetical protein
VRAAVLSLLLSACAAQAPVTSCESHFLGTQADGKCVYLVAVTPECDGSDSVGIEVDGTSFGSDGLIVDRNEWVDPTAAACGIDTTVELALDCPSLSGGSDVVTATVTLDDAPTADVDCPIVD